MEMNRQDLQDFQDLFFFLNLGNPAQINRCRAIGLNRNNDAKARLGKV